MDSHRINLNNDGKETVNWKNNLSKKKRLAEAEAQLQNPAERIKSDQTGAGTQHGYELERRRKDYRPVRNPFDNLVEHATDVIYLVDEGWLLHLGQFPGCQPIWVSQRRPARPPFLLNLSRRPTSQGVANFMSHARPWSRESYLEFPWSMPQVKKSGSARM